EHDLAEFLKGEQRDTCQHVRVRHGKVHNLQDVKEEQDQVENTTQNVSKCNRNNWKSHPPGKRSLGRPFKQEDDTASNGEVTRESPDISALLQRVSSARPHIPRSRSSLAQYTNPQHLVPEKLNRRAHSSLDKPRIRRPPEVEVLLRPDNMNFGSQTDIHIYILQGGSTLLNQLQSCWCARLLSSTLEIAERKTTALTGGRDTRKLERVYEHFKRELLDPNNSADHSFDLLQELHVGLQRNPDLKKIFWKDQMLYHYLTQRLQMALMSEHTDDSDNILTERTEELECAALALDILLLTLQDSDSVQDKVQMFLFNSGSMLKRLLLLMVMPPHIPLRYRNTCSHMLEDFHEFSSSGWSNLPEAEVNYHHLIIILFIMFSLLRINSKYLIRLLAEVTNISTAILYELLLTLRNFVHNNPNLKINKLLEGVALECHLKRSVTQLLAMLFPPQAHRLKPLEAVLVYQHFYVLKCLMENLSRVRDYIQEQFQEEFRYYIHWSRVGRKLSDNYPIKRLLQQLVDGVHQLASTKYS
ncbi:hypothetical protein L9F63_005972, partial [Diploptera punctata]